MVPANWQRNIPVRIRAFIWIVFSWVYADLVERHLLGAWRYTQNQAFLHSATSLMPRRKKVWSSWNFIGPAKSDNDRKLCVTYWMNRLQRLDTEKNYIVTLNPSREPHPGSIEAEFEYDHPMFDMDALNAQRKLWQIQGIRNTWFCGSYFGFGFHEDALQSGLAVAEDIGGVLRPWDVENESGRIYLGPPREHILERAA